MVERSIYNKARRVKAWFNIKNMDNAITLVEYYPDYDYEDFNVLFEQIGRAHVYHTLVFQNVYHIDTTHV